MTEPAENAPDARMRERVLDVIAMASTPVDAAQVAEELGLHLTTARFHLARLEDDGLVKREVNRAGSRGRPRMVFRVAPSVRGKSAQRQLIEVLVGALAGEPDAPDRSVAAGEHWADELSAARAEMPAAASDVLIGVLDRLGFDPAIADAGLINLLACPFRDVAAEHPGVVCSVHRGLIDRTLERAGGELSGRLTPFVEPELCTISLASASRSTVS